MQRKLFGRGDELAWLHFCAEEAARGKPRLAVVSGDAGIGKSRVLQTLLNLSPELGAAVGLGRGYEDAGIPYLPIHELFASLEADLERLGDGVASDDSPAACLGNAPDRDWDAADADSGDRGRLFVSVSSRLLALAAKRPLVLAIDDLHWLDESSLALLSHLAFAVGDAAQRGPLRVLMIVTTRPFEDDCPAARSLARLRRETLCESLELVGIDPLAARGLLAQCGVPHASDQLVASVLEVTRGNPLFIETLASELVRTDAIEFVQGDAVARVELAELPMAADLDVAIAARLSGIGSHERELFEHAALLGSPFDPALLARVLEQPNERVYATLVEHDELVRARGDGFEFELPLVRHELSRRMPRPLRRQRHARIAQLLHRDETSSAWQVARHFIAAGPLADREGLHHWGRRAGDEAFRVCAWREAGEAYAAAASVAPSQIERATLHYQAGRCFMKNYDHGIRGEHFRRALEGFEASGDVVAAARTLAESARSDLYELPLGELRDMKPFEHALSQLGEDQNAQRGSLYARMADSYFYASRAQQGRDYAVRALECGSLAKDHDLCADAGMSLALAEQQALHFESAKEKYGAALDEITAGEGWLECAIRVRAGSASFMLGEIGEARRQWDEAEQASHRLNDAAEEALAVAYSAGAAACLGNFVEAEARVETALRLASRLERRPWVPMVAVPTLAYVRFLQGNFAAAADALAALNEPGRLIDKVGRAVHSTTNAYRALIRAASGGGAEGGLQPAVALLERYASRTTPDHADGMGLGIVCALVEMADLLGMPAALDGPTRVLEVAYEEGALFATGWPCLVPRLLGLSCFSRQQFDQAEVFFAEALHKAREVGALPELARTQFEAARSLVAAGGLEREQRARDLVEQACELASRLGMDPTWRRASALAQSIGLHVPERAVGGGLRERDHLLLARLAQGHSDGRLATDLLLSPHTLRRELGELFGRLGVEDRKHAVALAANEGLLPEPERGIPVTLLVTDIQNFTPLVERLGDAAAQDLIQAHNRTLRGTIRNHSGIEVAHTGDGIIASFRSSVEALACAIDIQRTFERGEIPNDSSLRLRLGLHAGETLAEESRLFGLAVNTTVRICARSEAGQILVSDTVHAEARHYRSRLEPAGTHALKGISREVPLYRVRWKD